MKHYIVSFACIDETGKLSIKNSAAIADRWTIAAVRDFENSFKETYGVYNVSIISFTEVEKE